ncbi:MAG: DUF1641 domain-containing protein [Nocardioides sp.]|jgi:uncharacterized protein YjgD (DUF1641 family)
MTATHTATQAQSADALVERLQDPAVVGALSKVLDHADLLALLVESLDQFVSRSEVIGDSLAAGLDELRGAVEGGASQSPLDLAELVAAGSAIARTLPAAAPALSRMADSGAIDKLIATAEVSAGALDQVDTLARGLVRGSNDFAGQPVEIGGPLTLLKLLKDPDINRALSFFATVARAVGRELKQA